MHDPLFDKLITVALVLFIVFILLLGTLTMIHSGPPR